MTQNDALRVREVWAQSGRPACEHPIVALEHSADRQYLTGRYVCTTCGLIYGKESCPQPTTRPCRHETV